MKKTIALLLLAIAAAVILPLGGASAGQGTLRVKALIDGNSALFMKGNKIWWVHRESAPPGYWNGQNEPTFVNGERWMPAWPARPAMRSAIKAGKEVSSQPRVLNGLVVPATSAGVKVEKVHGRGEVRVIEAPNPANPSQTCLSLDFDDPIKGAEWYEVVVHW